MNAADELGRPNPYDTAKWPHGMEDKLLGDWDLSGQARMREASKSRGIARQLPMLPPVVAALHKAEPFPES